ncbi:MAG: HlyD family efflux transporter periplasmic adaptor subunit [Phycisphaerales bacterium]|nr:HlyD family efflux transporter periplasmic adaptor subunit [Phycisphaerales bacterium]
MFRDDPGPTFSDIWYRVGPTRPRLSPHAHVVRQRAGDGIAYIVEEPAGGQFYRLTEPAYFFLGLMDGAVTVSQAWDACNAQLGDAAPTQRECLEVLSRLQMYGLLLGELPLAADMVVERKRLVRSRWWLRRTGRGLFLTLPLVNPERWLERYAHILRGVWSRAGMAVWLLVVGSAAALLLANLRRFGSGLDTAALMAPSNLIWMSVSFLVLRALHELGHATSCKAMGGRCTEMGVLVIAWLVPLPYCDATSAWRFQETWRRVLVSAAGMMVELFVASLAVFVWASRPGRGDLVEAMAYNTILVSGIATLVFNLNPLLRYDGYYMLSDLLGIPNLAQRSRDFWKFLAERFAFGMATARPPHLRGAGEAWWLGIYGLLSWPYRLLVAFAIIMVIAGAYATLGVVLAIVTGIAWIIWPLLRGVGYVLASPALMGRRVRAVGVTGAAVAALLAVAGLVPLPAAGYAPGLIAPAAIAGVRAPEAGFVRSVLARAGQRVHAGDPLFQLENEQLEVEAAAARARRDRARTDLDISMAKSPAEQQAARAHLAQAEKELARATEQVASLLIRAAIDGRVAPARGTGLDVEEQVGRFVSRGTLLAYVSDTDHLVVRAWLPEHLRAFVFRGGVGSGAWPQPTVRIRGQVGDEIPARVTRLAPAGVHEVESAALSAQAGGELTMDPEDRDGKRALEALFLVELETAVPPEGAQPGLRARVRFGVPPEPLLARWWRGARRVIGERLHG